MNRIVYFLLACFFIAVPSFVYSASLDYAEKAYLRGDYNETIRVCLEKINNGDSDKALYFTGLSLSKLGSYSRARVRFRRLLREFKSSDFYNKALVKFVDTYFLEGSIDKADSLYKSMLKEYPNFPYKPVIYLRMAQVSAKRGKWQDKNYYINIVESGYPGSPEAKIAKKLERRGNFFTVQAGAFSIKRNAIRFYKRLRRDYPAYITDEKENDFILYKVRVGKYKTRYEAKRVYNKLMEEGYPAKIYP